MLEKSRQKKMDLKPDPHISKILVAYTNSVKNLSDPNYW